MPDISAFQSVLQEASLASATPSPPDVLYHYTGLDGTMKIIESDTMHASDIRYLNDSLEHRFAWRLIQDIANRLAAAANQALTRDVLRLIARLPADHMAFSGGAFVSSFSTQPDLLSQWRAYGDDGRGVALGFSTAAPLTCGGEGQPLLFHKVIYERSAQVSVLQPYVDAIVRITEHLAEQGDESVRDGAVSAMLTLAALLGTTIKNPAFSEECEWRTVVPYLGPLAPIHLTKVRRGRIGLVPYCELRANGESSRPSLPLKEIVVGPRFDGLQLNAFITYLAVNGYEAAMPGLLARQDLAPDSPTILIGRSKASYR